MSEFSRLSPKDQLREIDTIISSGEPAPWTIEELRYLHNAVATSMGELHFPYKTEEESLTILDNLIETHVDPVDPIAEEPITITAPKVKRIETNTLILIVVVVFSVVLSLIGTVVTALVQQ